MKIAKEISEIFTSRFGHQPGLYRAPGRINLIGEHTDYNNGFVLPAAVNHAIYLAAAPNKLQKVRVYSVDFDELFEFDLARVTDLQTDSWRSYVFGVVAVLYSRGYLLPGFDTVLQGDVPQGAGMSSSAALECGVCCALNDLFGLGLDKVEMTKIAQQAEHQYVGVMCGIMDQFASMMGRQGHALLLDCRSLDYEHFPLELQGAALLLLNSNVTHSLADTEYNVRRAQCEEGVSILQKRYPQVQSLRDVDLTMLNQEEGNMPAVVFKRCRYVLDESRRVHAFARAMRDGKLTEAGEILIAAQQAMSVEYEITCPEIDFMANFANRQPEVFGARMMGGGFGGCTINLIRKGGAAHLIQRLSEAYRQAFNLDLTPIEITTADGAGRIDEFKRSRPA